MRAPDQGLRGHAPPRQGQLPAILDALVENPATTDPAEQARAIRKARDAALADPEGKALGGALGKPVTWLKQIKG